MAIIQIQLLIYVILVISSVKSAADQLPTHVQLVPTIQDPLIIYQELLVLTHVLLVHMEIILKINV
jgi:hypothetical protein